MKNVTPFLAVLLISLRSTGAFSPHRGGVTTSARRGAATSLFSAPARALPEGISKTTTVEGTGRPVRVGDAVVVKYFCTAAGSDAAFARSDRQRVVAADGTMIRGWDAAIRTMREGERASVRISDPRFAYGEAGVPPFVPPNSVVDIDLEVLAVEDGVGMGASLAGGSALDSMGMEGPASRPRTPAAIAAAYERKMKEKELNKPVEREGIEGIIDKVRGFYIFGIFEGETGQEAPWYLKPSITFPLAFLVVGAAFFASLFGGAISERGVPVTDDLDEIIISADVIRAGVAVALVTMQM